MNFGRVIDGARIGVGLVMVVVEAVRSRKKPPTWEELRDALRVGGPTAEARRRAQAEADARWPRREDVP